MAREAQVVVGAEHDDALTVDDGLVAFVVVERLVEGIEPEGFRCFGEGERAGFREDIAARSIVVPVNLEGIDVDGFRDLFVACGLRFGGQVISSFLSQNCSPLLPAGGGRSRDS
jgi:hypothetical protein